MNRFYPVILFNLLLAVFVFSAKASQPYSIDPEIQCTVVAAEKVYDFFQLPVGQPFKNKIYDAIHGQSWTLASCNEQGAPIVVSEIAQFFYNEVRDSQHLDLLGYTFMLTPKEHRAELYGFLNASVQAGTGPTLAEKFPGIEKFLCDLPFRPEFWTRENGMSPLKNAYGTLKALHNAMQWPLEEWAQAKYKNDLTELKRLITIRMPNEAEAILKAWEENPPSDQELEEMHLTLKQMF